MNTQQDNSTFLIKSSQNTSFGTGFVVYKNGNLSYLVTCAHVVESCKENSLLVQGKVATLVAIGSKDEIDLAVISVKDLECQPLNLATINVYEDMKFQVKGFKKHLNQNHKFESLDGVIKKTSQLIGDEKEIDIYELSLYSEDSIEKGYSGSAIYSVESGYVFAVAISRYTDKHADAISIKYLREIWSEMPVGLLIEESILDQETANLQILKRISIMNPKNQTN
jgi:hypothetical protein